MDLNRELRDAKERFEEQGYAILRAYDDDRLDVIERFARDWVTGLVRKGAGGRFVDRPLETYHQWWDELSIDHSALFRAPARHARPEGAVRAALLSPTIWSFLGLLGDYDLWDEGLGWLGFRFIRPGMGDGYPPSRKEWGPAKAVVSVWIPVIGRTAAETLALVPGSHRREYARYMPTDGKFCADEYRLADPRSLVFVRPELERGEVIFTHPRLVHTEDVVASQVTRLNLEMRFTPRRG